MSPPGRRLAVDYGRKRIGLAICDALGITTRALPVVTSRTLTEDLAEIGRHCKEEQVVGIIIGIPRMLDGSDGRAVDEVRAFAGVLREKLHLEVEEEDERLSTRSAHAMLKDAGHSHAQRKGKLDSTAAMLILRSWLQRRKSSGA